MTSLRPRADHQEAVARRLASLTAELAATGPEGPPASAADEPWLADHTRIRPLRTVPDPGPDLMPEVPRVPEVGRHAARRGRRPPALLPESLRGRVVLGPSQLLVVAVLVAVGLALTAWWVVRGDPERLEAPGPTTAGSTAPPLAGVTPPASAVESPAVGHPVAASASATGASVTVDVTGKVRKPGIVVLDVGMRVVDAIDAAGGARPGVDLSSLNLARVLVDGEQVVVGRAAGPVPAGSSGSSGSSGALVDLNTATQEQLEALPEVGPVTAESILAWRSEHGGFTAVDELLEVDGIGDATLAQIAPHVTV